MNAKSRAVFGFVAGALALAVFLSVCSRPDPQAALNVAAEEFQAALEARDANKALELMHQDFVVESSAENGREWAKKTMSLVFMRYKHVKIMVLDQTHRISPDLPDRAISTGDIALVGAEGVLPDEARRYRVQLGWIREGDQWKLLRLKWE